MLNTNKRLNSLLTRMLSSDAQAQTSSSSCEPQDTTPKMLSSNNSGASTKRNLFGIRLNHDQLKQDLTEMWKEQCEMQKCKWNFDFETLKPVNATKTGQANATNAQNTENNANTRRYEWHRVNLNYKTGLDAKSSGEMQSSAFSKDELGYYARPRRNMFENSFGFSDNDDNEEDEEEEEEEDLALAIPQFYKYQRRLKLNDENNRIKYMKLKISQTCDSTMTPAKQQQLQKHKQQRPRQKQTKKSEQRHSPLFDSVSSFQPIFQIKTTNVAQAADSKKATRSGNKRQQTAKTTTATTKMSESAAAAAAQVVRPKAIRTKRNRVSKTSQQFHTPLKLTTQNLNLIITFSENRKDTLRSATTTTITNPDLLNTKLDVSESSAFQPVSSSSSTTTATANTFNTPLQHSTASRPFDNLKQQTLLDLFKQRKRRNSSCLATASTNPYVESLIKQSSTASKLKPTTSHFLRSHTSSTSS